MSSLNHKVWGSINDVEVISTPQFNYFPQMLPMNIPIPLLSLFKRAGKKIKFLHFYIKGKTLENVYVYDYLFI